jgi:hypothetical protein
MLSPNKRRLTISRAHTTTETCSQREDATANVNVSRSNEGFPGAGGG